MSNKSFRANFNAKDIINYLNNASKQLRDLSPIMKIARVFLKNTVDDNFETQGEATGEKWAPWSDSWKKRRIKMGRGSGKILNLEGHLRRDIRAKSGKDFALVGTNKEYAAIHNFGGNKNLKRNKTMPKREFMRLNKSKKEELLAELYLGVEERLMDMRNLKE